MDLVLYLANGQKILIRDAVDGVLEPHYAHQRGVTPQPQTTMDEMLREVFAENGLVEVVNVVAQHPLLQPEPPLPVSFPQELPSVGFVFSADKMEDLRLRRPEPKQDFWKQHREPAKTAGKHLKGGRAREGRNHSIKV